MSRESEEITQKSSRLLFFLIPAVTAVIGFCISNRDKLQPLKTFDVLLIIAIGGCVADCIYLLFKLTGPKKVFYRGTKPEEMMREQIFKLNDAVQIQRAIYVSEIERFQIKIERMEFWNRERIGFYTEAVYAFNILLALGIALLLRVI